MLATSCSDPAEAPERFTRDLLRRRPDAVVDQTGLLVPDEESQWGAHGPVGWEGKTASEFAGRSIDHVWSRQLEAGLRLPAGRPAARMLVIELWGPLRDGSEARAVEIRLNGLSVEEAALPSTPTTLRIQTPQELWKEGDNLLELVVPRLVELQPGRDVGLALARVEYAEPHCAEIDPSERELVLHPETSVAYEICELAPLTIVVVGHADGTGTLEARLETIDPATGAVVDTLTSVDVPVADRSLERGFNVAGTSGGLVRLRMAWRSHERDSAFVVERLEACDTAAVARPSVIFISKDTLSARHMSLYGGRRDTTPGLERFAREAVVFEHCRTNAPWTLPSYMSQMTGLYPYAHNLERIWRGRSESTLWEQWYLAENRWTLAELLRAAGYDTAGFVDNQWIVERFGFSQGFDTYDASAGAVDKTDMSGGIRRVASLAEDWLDDRADSAPLFLFVHCFDVHGPYSPPADFRDRFRGDGMADPAREAPAPGEINCFGVIATYIARGEVPEGSIPERLHTADFEEAYDEGISFVDTQLEALFADLRRRGIWDEAIVIVSADHGETMSDGAFLFGHGVMDEDVLHVPLLIKLPHGADAGRRIPDFVQLVDLYPTILELTGVGTSVQHLHGRSLVPLLRGYEAHSAPAYSEGGVMAQSSVVSGGWKLVEYRPGVDSSRQLILSLPKKLRWMASAVADKLEGAGTDPELVRELRLRGLSREFFAWLKDHERDPTFRTSLVDTGVLEWWKKSNAQLADVWDLEDELGRRGLTEPFYDELQARPEFESVVAYLRFELAGPFYELFDLASDPDARRDLARERPEKLAELLPVLRAEQERREVARKAARPPAARAELSAEEIAQLAAIGYAETGSAKPPRSAPPERDL
jgi:arylsulfatase